MNTGKVPTGKAFAIVSFPVLFMFVPVPLGESVATPMVLLELTVTALLYPEHSCVNLVP